MLDVRIVIALSLLLCINLIECSNSSNETVVEQGQLVFAHVVSENERFQCRIAFRFVVVVVASFLLMHHIFLNRFLDMAIAQLLVNIQRTHGRIANTGKRVSDN